MGGRKDDYRGRIDRLRDEFAGKCLAFVPEQFSAGVFKPSVSKAWDD